MLRTEDLEDQGQQLASVFNLKLLENQDEREVNYMLKTSSMWVFREESSYDSIKQFLSCLLFPLFVKYSVKAGKIWQGKKNIAIVKKPKGLGLPLYVSKLCKIV